MTSRRKNLNADDLALWKRVTDTTIPLHAETEDFEAILQRVEQQMADSRKKQKNLQFPGIVSTGRKVTPTPPTPMASPPPLMRNIPLSAKIDNWQHSQEPLDRKTRKKISKGKTSIDATLDLHGMTQDRAHQALRRFLMMARAADHRIVLVITGKGIRTGGVLKNSVPEWLRHGEMSALTNGHEWASKAHGGDGALYIRIRRQNSNRR